MRGAYVQCKTCKKEVLRFRKCSGCAGVTCIIGNCGKPVVVSGVIDRPTEWFCTGCLPVQKPQPNPVVA